MTSPDPDLHVVTVVQTDPRLGRNVVHDPRSRRFAFPVAAVWLYLAIAVYLVVPFREISTLLRRTAP